MAAWFNTWILEYHSNFFSRGWLLSAAAVVYRIYCLILSGSPAKWKIPDSWDWTSRYLNFDALKTPAGVNDQIRVVLFCGNAKSSILNELLSEYCPRNARRFPVVFRTLCPGVECRTLQSLPDLCVRSPSSSTGTPHVRGFQTCPCSTTLPKKTPSCTPYTHKY